MVRLDQTGDTLIEVILAMAILAFVLISSFNIAQKAFFVGAGSRERTQAANLAQEQAEALHNFRDSNPATWPLPAIAGTFHMDPAGGWHAVSGSVVNSIFTVQVGQTPVFPANPNQNRFIVEVGWDGMGGGPKVMCGGVLRTNCSRIVTDLVNLQP